MNRHQEEKALAQAESIMKEMGLSKSDIEWHTQHGNSAGETRVGVSEVSARGSEQQGWSVTFRNDNGLSGTAVFNGVRAKYLSSDCESESKANFLADFKSKDH